MLDFIKNHSFDDADLEKTIPCVARACFFLQGQNCMAGTRVFVHEYIHYELVAGVKSMAESFQIGHGLIETNDFELSKIQSL